MKFIKLLICVILCLCLSFTTLCGCFDGENPLKLVRPEEKSEEAKEYETLEQDEKVEFLITEMKKAFSKGEKTVDFNFDCSKQLFDAFRIVSSENPQFFWLTKSSSYEITTRGEVSTIVFKPKILLKDKEIASMQKEIDAEAQKVLAGIDANATDYEKVLYIHDYIVDNTVYDSDGADFVTENPEADLPQDVHNSTSIYGCLVKRRAICSGYAATFKYLADKLGLECLRVSGNSVETGEAHQWNCVKVDGAFYYIDVTWDDKVAKDPNKHMKDYDYFLITEKELLLTHTIKEDQKVPECVSEKYNYFVYNGLYMEEYTFKAFSQLIKAKLPFNKISIKFGSSAEREKAYNDLFKGDKRFWKISAIKAKTVSTSMSETGLILNIML